jgi:hypothetical protein
MRVFFRIAIVTLLCVATTTGFAAKKRAINDYPTLDRVEFVEACIRDYPDKPRQEMIYKCSCMIDEIAKAVPHEQYIDISTSFKAITIAGDRGAIREAKPVQNMAKKFREIQATARKSCLIQ